MSQVLKPRKGYKLEKWYFGKEIEIPEEWDVLTLKENSFVTDGSHLSPPKVETGLPMATVENVRDTDLDIESCYKISKEDFEQLTKNNCKPEFNDVLFTKDGTVGKSLVFTQDTNVVVLSSIAILKPFENLDSYFLHYSFCSEAMTKFIAKYLGGTAIKRIVLKNLEKFVFPFPLLQEQQQIASILSNVDNLITSTQKIIDQTKSLKQGLMQKLLTKGIGNNKFKKIKWLFRKEIEIPKEWEVTFLAKLILSTKNGFSGQPNDESRGLPRLGITSVTDSNSLYVNENLHRFIEIPKSIINDYQVKKNDLLVCRQNGNKPSVGKIRIVKKTIKPLIFSDSLILTRVDMKKVNPEFLVFFLDSLDGKKQISKYLGTTAGNYSINATDLRKIEIPCPPLSEQQQISTILSNVDSQIIFQTQYKEKLEKLKKSLMQKLLTGEVRVIV